jgi:hypothetical protein
MNNVYLFALCPAGALFQLTQQPQGVVPVRAAKLLRCLIGNAYIGTFCPAVDLTDVVCSKLYAPNSRRLPLRHARDRRRERGCDTTGTAPETTNYSFHGLFFALPRKFNDIPLFQNFVLCTERTPFIRSLFLIPPSLLSAHKLMEQAGFSFIEPFCMKRIG